MLFQGFPRQTKLDQFETFRNCAESALPSEDEESKELRTRIGELEQEIRECRERGRQLEAANSKLNQIIVGHHTKDAKDADRFIGRLGKVMERWGGYSSREDSASHRHSSRQKETLQEGFEAGRVKTQQSMQAD